MRRGEVGRLYSRPGKSRNLVDMMRILLLIGRDEVKAEIHGGFVVGLGWEEGGEALCCKS